MVKPFWLFCRFAIFLALQFAIPIMVKRGLRFDFLFVVYGTQEDLRSYYPKWFGSRLGRRLIFPFFITGIATKGKSGSRGLVIGLSVNPGGLSRDQLIELLGYIEGFASQVGARSIGLAGRLPRILSDARIAIRKPFVVGRRLTVAIAILHVEDVFTKFAFSKNASKVAVIGAAGFIGFYVVLRLRAVGYQVVGYDPKFQNTEVRGRATFTNDPSFISECPVAVLLTGDGKDIEGSIRYLVEGVVVADDTHPRMPRYIKERIQKEKRGIVYFIALFIRGVRFWPRLNTERPGRELVGCAVEAKFVAEGVNVEDQGVVDTILRDKTFINTAVDRRPL